MKTILVADDEDFLRLLVAELFEGGNYRVIEARNGEEAVRRAREESPDLLILDWTMPGMSGIEVLRALRSDPCTARIRVLMLSARAGRADASQAIELGVHEYLVKPFSPLELIRRVEEILSGAASRP